MKRDTLPPPDTEIDAAISRVLAAEQAAREAVAAVERESATLVEAARANARAIGERAERRIRIARERFEAKVAQDVDAIRQEAAALETRHVLTPAELARVEQAVRAIAAELTGVCAMIPMSGLEYAHARLWARFGARPTEFEWRRIEVVRDYAALIDTARAIAPFGRWLAGLTADADAHAVEVFLRARFRARVEEVAGWMPEAWQDAVRWCATVVDLPLLAHVGRMAMVPPWTAADTVWRSLLANPPGSAVGVGLARTSLAPLAPMLADPARLTKAWAHEWQRRLPARALSEAERQSFARLYRLLRQHLAAFPAAHEGDGWSLRRTLVAELERLFRRTPTEPAAPFIFLALVGLDGERLRGELARRIAFPRLTLAA